MSALLPVLADILEENMRSQTSKIRLMLSLIITSILLFALAVPAFARDYTDGSELQIATPEQLEIQLGPEWARVEFRLKTDSGMYPGTIPVGDDGVLRLEIGGSSSYQLSCIGSAVPAPTPESLPSPAPSEKPSPTPAPTLAAEESAPPQATITVSEVEPVDPEFTPRDIPVWQEISAHADINDDGQTVTLTPEKPKTPTPDVPKTGDDRNITLPLILLGASLVGLATLSLFWFRRKKGSPQTGSENEGRK